jgi:hypothetical protein
LPLLVIPEGSIHRSLLLDWINQQLPFDLAAGWIVLPVILGWQGVSTRNRYLVTAGCAAVNARVRSSTAGNVRCVKSGVL